MTTENPRAAAPGAAAAPAASAERPRKVPAPKVLPETLAWWQAADTGRLLVKRCRACGEAHHYPRDICPFCLSDDTVWEDASGLGTVYSHSTMGQGAGAWTLAYVTLDEGPTMLTNLVGDPAGFAIGARVKVVFTPSDGGHAVPMFTPL